MNQKTAVPYVPVAQVSPDAQVAPVASPSPGVPNGDTYTSVLPWNNDLHQPQRRLIELQGLRRPGFTPNTKKQLLRAVTCPELRRL